MIDLCKAFDMPYHVIGIRPGEKLHEFMIAPDDITGNEGYSSGNNPHFLTIDEIKESIYGI
jgi:FlaA1/EpsC-like NDP-sugar epimerase